MSSIPNRIKARLPKAGQIWPVFSIILFIVFSWMLYRYFFQLPSWLYYMSTQNIFVLLAYTLSFSFVESLSVLLYVLFICFIFPGKFFKEIFIPQGSLQVIIITGLTYFLRLRLEDLAEMDLRMLVAIGIGLIIIQALSVVVIYMFLKRLPVTARWISSFAERMTIFYYLYAPLGVLCTLIVIVRNIL